MQQDLRGLAVTSENPEAVEAMDRAVAGMLAHRADTGAHLMSALAADEGLVIAQCLLGFVQLLLGRSELFPLAEKARQAAQASLAQRGGTGREIALTKALGAWCARDMDGCAAILEQILGTQPLDALAAKLLQSVLFMKGDEPGMRRNIESILPAWSAAIPGYGFLLGCHAFTLEEAGEFEAALRVGQQALRHEPFDVWGCHAVVHIHEMRGEAAQGLAWIAGHDARWGTVNNFARHLNWHRALFHLARREIDAALEIYDAKVREVATDDYRDIANGVGLLLRLESAGAAVGSRWTELADIAERRRGDEALVFARLHYLLALAGARRWDAAYRSLAALMEDAAGVGKAGGGTQARLAAEVGVPLAKAMLAILQGDASMGYIARQGMARQDIAKLGGSHAQRETFTRLLARARRPAPVNLPAPAPAWPREVFAT